MQLRCDCTLLYWHPEQCRLLIHKHCVKSGRKRNVIQDHYLCCTEMMNQQTPKKDTDTHRCLTKSWAQGWELGFSILSSKPLCLILKVIVCICCPVFVFPGPPSHILWPWPLLLTAAQFNLPNAAMGQVNQPPVRHWDPAIAIDDIPTL